MIIDTKLGVFSTENIQVEIKACTIEMFIKTILYYNKIYSHVIEQFASSI